MNNKYIKKEYFHNNGIIEGECKSYYKNGNIKEEAYYINGQKKNKFHTNYCF